MSEKDIKVRFSFYFSLFTFTFSRPAFYKQFTPLSLGFVIIPFDSIPRSSNAN
jgi:hypothetical protein